ncbi:MAG TPA: class I SAM-dependent methyltransferase [bacterium]|nr:class I SAM-dependent methyltransferase [bacterium]
MNPDEYRIMYELEEDYWWYRGMRAITATVLARVIGEPKGLHLDAGCGTGGNLKFLGRLYKSYGLDLAGEAMPFLARNGLTRAVRASVLAIPFPAGCFDLVTAFESVQGVDDDAAAFRELHRVTRPGGRILVREAALDALAGEHDLADASVRRYTRRGLEEKIRRAGFNVVFSTYANFLLLPPIFFIRSWRRMLGKKVPASRARTDFRFSPSRLNRFFFGCLLAEAAWLSRFRLPFGVSVIAVGEKEEPS